MNEELWSATLSQIRESIPENEYSSWFSRLSFGSETDGNVVLYVPSAFFLDRFESQYKALLENTLSEIGDRQYRVSFEINKNAQNALFVINI